jgi:glycosyltransferase involved in cell wall biosynthesis
VVHCGIEPDIYSDRKNKKDIEGVFRIISIGSLQLYKGQSFLLEACKLLSERGLPIICQIIGDGELFESLETQIRDIKLEGIVALTGPQKQDEVADLLASADCYVQPSVVMPSGKKEGIPVALMEALASELPVVASDLSGIPELIRHKETGLLVPERDPVAIADALEWMNNHTQQAIQMAQAGRKLVLREFNLARNVHRLAELFETAVQNV